MPEEIVLYTTHCPKCKILEAKLQRKNIPYNQFTDVDEMIKMKITSVPFLKVGEKLLDFVQANAYINSL